MTEQELEGKIKHLKEQGHMKGLRLTPADIDGTIEYAEYWRVPNTTTTVCALVLKNGYTVVGKSASISMENYNEDIGKQIAYDNAREQIWALAGFAIKQIQYEGKE